MASLTISPVLMVFAIGVADLIPFVLYYGSANLCESHKLCISYDTLSAFVNEILKFTFDRVICSSLYMRQLKQQTVLPQIWVSFSNFKWKMYLLFPQWKKRFKSIHFPLKKITIQKIIHRSYFCCYICDVVLCRVGWHFKKL